MRSTCSGQMQTSSSSPGGHATSCPTDPTDGPLRRDLGATEDIAIAPVSTVEVARVPVAAVDVARVPMAAAYADAVIISSFFVASMIPQRMWWQ